MSASAIQEAMTHKPCELGQYTLSDEARVLVGRLIEGVLHVFDHPRDGGGRRYFVEAGFESDRELAVLLADYRRQAKRVGACPMSSEAIGRGLHMQPAGPTPPQVGTP
jgi:hypothetical protein